MYIPASVRVFLCSCTHYLPTSRKCDEITHEKINGHRELTVSSPWAHGDHGGHGSGAQWSRLGHG